MDVTCVERLDRLPAAEWDALNRSGHPFLSHAFLSALERHGCVGEPMGWVPQHLVARDGNGRLAGAVPLYRKTHSFGEFVFDWAWAEAHHRVGLPYYPKLVAAVPWSPVTGPRVLTRAADDGDTADRLIAAALRATRELSSLHWLFPDEGGIRRLEHHGLGLRSDCQYHWHNAGYSDFDAFLAALTAERRKKIRRERRRVAEADIRLQWVGGGDATAEQWARFHRFYMDTYDRYGGIPGLTAGFSEAIGHALGDGVQLLEAHQGRRCVAAALFLQGPDTLYGRYWGCSEDHHSLHFECCYYQGIERCIRKGLARFEPGAQGEHKIWRGFRPVLTWSAHWINDPELRDAINNFLARERAAVAARQAALDAHTPYRA